MNCWTNDLRDYLEYAYLRMILEYPHWHWESHVGSVLNLEALPWAVQSGPDDESSAGWLDYVAAAGDGADVPYDVVAVVVAAVVVVDGGAAVVVAAAVDVVVAAAVVVAVAAAVVVAAAAEAVAENVWVNAHAGDEMLAREFPCGC